MWDSMLNEYVTNAKTPEEIESAAGNEFIY